MDWSAISIKLLQIPGNPISLMLKLNNVTVSVGVVETGLFINMAARTYFGNSDGTVKVMDKSV